MSSNEHFYLKKALKHFHKNVSYYFSLTCSSNNNHRRIRSTDYSMLGQRKWHAANTTEKKSQQGLT
jgi:hypothetical protein